MGELTVSIVFPTVAMHMHRSSPLVPLDSCLTAAAYVTLVHVLAHVHSLCHTPVILRY